MQHQIDRQFISNCHKINAYFTKKLLTESDLADKDVSMSCPGKRKIRIINELKFIQKNIQIHGLSFDSTETIIEVHRGDLSRILPRSFVKPLMNLSI